MCVWGGGSARWGALGGSLLLVLLPVLGGREGYLVVYLKAEDLVCHSQQHWCVLSRARC